MQKQATSMIGRLILLGILWLLAGNLSFAQTIVTGIVQDEHKAPLPHSVVKLLKPNGQLHKGTSTDAKGGYRLSNIATGKYTLEVSFVGYTPIKREVTVKAGETALRVPTIALEPDSKTLGELTVLGRAAEVKVKGDTIEYNAGSYSVEQGATLNELLKKLPGAEVDENGKITINGKEIKQIMVDGKRFFAGDPKIASKNLPADLIDKLQVVDRDSDAARMSGFSDGDEETIINLTIKPGRKKGIFGTAALGGGTQKRYEGNGILNRFADDDQWTILLGANNTNNAGFADIASDLSQSGLMGSVMGGGRGRSRGGFFGGGGITSSRMLGANIIHNFGTTFVAGGNAYLGNTDKIATNKSYKQNILKDGSTTEDGSTEDRTKGTSVSTTARLEWKPSKQTELILTPTITYGKSYGDYVSSSTTINDATGQIINRSNTSQHSTQDNVSGGLELDFSRRIGDKGRTLSASLSARMGLDDGDGDYRSSLDQAGKPTIIRDQRLVNERRNLNTRARLSWVEPLGGGFFTQLTYQHRFTTSESTRNAYNVDANGQYSVLDQNYSNEFRSDFHSHRVGLALKKKGERYDLTAGFNLDPSSLSSHTVKGQQKRDINQSNLNYSPTLRWSYKPQKGINLSVDYRGSSFQPSVDQMAPVQDVTNPLVELVGNPDLKPGYRHNLRLNYNAFFSKSLSSINLFASTEYVQNDIVSRSTYDLTTGKRTIGYTNVDGNGRLVVGAFYNTPLPGKKFSLNAGLMNIMSQQIGYINGEENRSRSVRLIPSLTLNYRYGIFDTGLTGRWAYYTVDNTLATASKTSDTHDYSATWSSNLRLPFGLSLSHNLRFSTTKGYAGGLDQTQWMLNASVSYSFLEGQKATIRLSGYDLLAQERSIFRSVTALSVSSEEVNTLGRYAMLTFIYRFNSFGGRSGAAERGSRGARRMMGGMVHPM